MPAEDGGGRLVVCPTPIGNLDDVTPRVLRALGSADVVACEDTRRTGVLLARFGVRAAELVSLHEHNERARAGALVARMASEGAVVALCSDAGMPVVSDPGYVLVREAIAAGVRVEVLPGPSSVDVALVASGLGSEPWRFAGFLPRRRGELERAFAAPETTVAFESPRRVAASLEVLAAIDPSRPVAVCRELTKVHEEVLRGEARSVAGELASRDEVRGEIVVVFAGAAADGAAAVEAAEAAVGRLVDAGARARPAASVVAELTGVPANALYDAVLRRRGRAS